MKQLSFVNRLISAIAFIAVFSLFVQVAFGLPWEPVAIVLAIASVVMPFITAKTGILFYAGVYREVWTGELVKRLSNADQNSFLNGLQDKSRYVTGDDEAQVIHMSYLGVIPDVLINNTTYPLDIQALGDEDIAINLDKYQTKATPVTDDELTAISYQRIGAVNETHGIAIAEKKQAKALHALGAAADTSATPVLLTTGDDDGTGRLTLTMDDLVDYKKKIDQLKHPMAGRRLVFCADHISDILKMDQKFADQYYNAQSGAIYKRIGFEFYEHLDAPWYAPATKVKKSFGAVPAGTDRQATVYFHAQRSVIATGKTKMYWSKAENDPLNQRNLINYRHYYIVLPMRNECQGAIVSNNA